MPTSKSNSRPPRKRRDPDSDREEVSPTSIAATSPRTRPGSASGDMPTSRRSSQLEPQLRRVVQDAAARTSGEYFGAAERPFAPWQISTDGLLPHAVQRSLRPEYPGAQRLYVLFKQHGVEPDYEKDDWECVPFPKPESTIKWLQEDISRRANKGCSPKAKCVQLRLVKGDCRLNEEDLVCKVLRNDEKLVAYFEGDQLPIVPKMEVKREFSASPARRRSGGIVGSATQQRQQIPEKPPGSWRTPSRSSRSYSYASRSSSPLSRSRSRQRNKDRRRRRKDAKTATVRSKRESPKSRRRRRSPSNTAASRDGAESNTSKRSWEGRVRLKSVNPPRTELPPTHFRSSARPSNEANPRAAVSVTRQGRSGSDRGRVYVTERTGLDARPRTPSLLPFREYRRTRVPYGAGLSSQKSPAQESQRASVPAEAAASLQEESTPIFWMDVNSHRYLCCVKDEFVESLLSDAHDCLYHFSGGVSTLDHEDCPGDQYVKSALAAHRTDDSIPSFYARAEYKGGKILALAGRKKDRLRTLKLAWSVYVASTDNVPIPDWISPSFNKLVDLARAGNRNVLQAATTRLGVGSKTASALQDVIQQNPRASSRTVSGVGVAVAGAASANQRFGRDADDTERANARRTVSGVGAAVAGAASANQQCGRDVAGAATANQQCGRAVDDKERANARSKAIREATKSQGKLVGVWRQHSKPRGRGDVLAAPLATVENIERGLLLHWLRERGLDRKLTLLPRQQIVDLEKGRRLISYAFEPQEHLVQAGPTWEVAYHGTWWYAIWSILHFGMVTESCDAEAGHEYWIPGIYMSPVVETARWYARPQVVFGDGIYHRVFLELRVDTERRTKSRQRGGVQWIFPHDAVAIHAVHFVMNDPPMKGDERFDDWTPHFEAIPDSGVTPRQINVLSQPPLDDQDFGVSWSAPSKPPPDDQDFGVSWSVPSKRPRVDAGAFDRVVRHCTGKPARKEAEEDDQSWGPDWTGK